MDDNEYSVSNSTDLLCCPFCGGAATGPEPNDNEFWIECENCEIVMYNLSKCELIKAWNKRAT